MDSYLTQIDPDIFTVESVFSDPECKALIQHAVELGFLAASVRTRNGPRMMSNIRNNQRVNLEDPILAERMWTRIRSYLPTLDGQVAVGVDPRLRFYRYLPGQQFRRHRDGKVTNDLGQVSQLTYLIYLNEDYQGGQTTFRDYYGTGSDRKIIEHQIEPVTGKALLFRHQRWHEGTEVIQGEKYVLRTDVFYDNQ